MHYFLGIVIGTSRVKAVLFDDHFNEVTSAAEATTPSRSAAGDAE
ncbi:MAG: hypothetical protein XXXJIFNMEKO3_00226 [Candidatus Erwinia impunctatus]|nr:hypothetical protein XXXJIFNMEKO_00226 [Culicoides impunctatus]